MERMPGPHFVGAPPGGMIDRIIFLVRSANCCAKISWLICGRAREASQKNHPVYHAARWGSHEVGTGHPVYHVFLWT